MAHSILTVAGTPGFGPYTATFTLGKLRDEYVTVRVNEEVDGLDDPLYRDIEWISDTMFNITSGTEPTGSDEVHIIRTMPIDTLIHDYENGATIEELNLDESNLQLIMLVHQFLDGRLETALANDLNMGNYKIINLADGEDPTDAVNLSQIQDIIDDIADIDAAVVAAEDAQDAAEAAQTGAEIAETNAETAQTAAEAAQAAAESAAAQAAIAAASGMYNDVITITDADSPYVPSLAQEGTLFRCDTTSGAIVINLSALSTYGEDMKFAFANINGANDVTVNRGGTDSIDSGTSLTLDTANIIHDIVGDSATGSWLSKVGSASVANDSITFAKLQNISTDTLIGRDAAGSGDATEITLGTELEFTGSNSIQIKDTSIVEAKLNLDDNTTNDVSTAQHGFCPKLPNDGQKVLAGDGAYRKRTMYVSRRLASMQSAADLSGTYTPSADVRRFWVFAIGSTGGHSSSTGIGGQGGPGYSEKLYSSPSGSYSWTSTRGGTTTFDTISITSSGAVTGTTGGTPGVGSGGDFNATGGSGGTGRTTATAAVGGSGAYGSRAGTGGNGGAAASGAAGGGGGTGGNASGSTGGIAASSISGSALVLPFGQLTETLYAGSDGAGATTGGFCLMRDALDAAFPGITTIIGSETIHNNGTIQSTVIAPFSGSILVVEEY